MARIGFYIPEVAFMNDNDPRKEGGKLSYQQIADELNQRWPQFNNGQRTRESVISFYRVKRNRADTQVRMITLPKAISSTLSGEDIQRIIISYAGSIGTKEV
jgi:hypothetical protein